MGYLNKNIMPKVVHPIFYLIGIVLFLFIIFPFGVLSNDKLTVVDFFRYSISPGLIAIFAALIGARIGALSHQESNVKRQAEMYWGLLDLVEQDINNNKDILNEVKTIFEKGAKERRDVQYHEINPQLAHTMFFDDIEYPELRYLINKNAKDIFHIRNIKYVYNRWNTYVIAFNDFAYSERKNYAFSSIKYYLMESPEAGDFILACDTALGAIKRVKEELIEVINKQK